MLSPDHGPHHETRQDRNQVKILLWSELLLKVPSSFLRQGLALAVVADPVVALHDTPVSLVVKFWLICWEHIHARCNARCDHTAANSLLRARPDDGKGPINSSLVVRLLETP